MTDEVKFQLRLGLIMKGGSSLAVYMNGMAQEMLALVRAAQARRLKGEAPEPEWVRAHREENPYYKLLEHYNIDVIIDVIAGTSAGGLNGLMLAKALASGAPDLDDLTRLWQETAQIYKLATYDPDPRSILSGQLLFDQMGKVMEGLTRKQNPAAARMVPILDLFVTATDIRGHKWVRRDKLNQMLEGKAHRYLFHLRKRERQDGDRGYNMNDFMSDDPEEQGRKDLLLAKIGQATSAFPAVFPPVKISRQDGLAAGVDILGDVDEAAQSGIWFSDGGILVNSPFEPVLETVFQRSATQPVKRVLAFVEPDPEVVTDPAQTEPSMLDTALSAVTLPMSQDILESLDRLNRENEQRRDLLQLMTDLDEAAAGPSTGGSGSPRDGEVRRARAPVLEAAFGVDPQQAEADRTVMPVYYRARLNRLRAVLWGALDRALEGLAVPARQRQAAVEAIIAEIPQFREPAATAPAGQPDTVEFLRTYDVEYQGRRLHFMLARLHTHFHAGCTPVHPREMEALLRGLWGAVEDWNTATWMLGHAGRLGEQPGRWKEPAAALDRAFISLAGAVRGGQEIPSPGTVQALGTFMRELRRLATVSEAEALSHAREGLKLEPAAGGPASAHPHIALAALGRINREFESQDVMLFPLQTYGLGAEWDAPELYQVTPGAAMGWVPREGKSKLAGDSLGHFGAFLDQRWRSNDIMWGRLDGAEILTRMIVTETTAAGPTAGASGTQVPETVQRILMDRRRQILKAFPDLIDLDVLRARTGRAVRTAAARAVPRLGFGDRILLAYRTIARGEAAAALDVEQPQPFGIDQVPDDVLREYLLKDYGVGTEGVERLPPRRVAAEILMLLHNAAHALQLSAPSSLQRMINRMLLVVLRPLNWMARLVLLPREGLAGMVQGNLVSLMTLVGAILLMLQLTGAVVLQSVGSWVTVALLCPFGLNVLVLFFRSVLMKVAGALLLLLALLSGLSVLGPALGLGKLAQWAGPFGPFWKVFAGVFCGYLAALWVQDNWRKQLGRAMERGGRSASTGGRKGTAA